MVSSSMHVSTMSYSGSVEERIVTMTVVIIMTLRVSVLFPRILLCPDTSHVLKQIIL